MDAVSSYTGSENPTGQNEPILGQSVLCQSLIAHVCCVQKYLLLFALSHREPVSREGVGLAGF